MSDIELDNLASLFNNSDNLDTTLNGYNGVPTGEDLSPQVALDNGKKILEEIKLEADKNFVYQLTNLFGDAERLAEAIQTVVQNDGIAEGREVHDYMGFYDSVGKGIKGIISEENLEMESDVSVIVASAQYPNWLNAMEGTL